VFRFGCYAGEVLRRQRKVAWAEPHTFMDEPSLEWFPFIVLRYRNDRVWAPINKAFAVLENGERSDSLHFSCTAEINSTPRHETIWDLVTHPFFKRDG
jgi:hypothetical protein